MDRKVCVKPKSLQGERCAQTSKPPELPRFIFNVQMLQGGLRPEAGSKHLSSLCLRKTYWLTVYHIREEQGKRRERKRKEKICSHQINGESPGLAGGGGDGNAL